MEIDLTDLVDSRVMPYVRRCPVDAARVAFVDTMRDFCNFTRCYQEESTDTIQALVSEYEVDAPVSTVEPISIELMTVNNGPCEPKDHMWLSRFLGANWRTRQADDFRYFTMIRPGVFAFPGIPTRMGSIDGVWYRASYRPKTDATTVEDSIANEYLDAIVEGALGRLKGMGGTPPPAWYDREGARDANLNYRKGRADARIKVSKGLTGATQTFNARRRFA